MSIGTVPEHLEPASTAAAPPRSPVDLPAPEHAAPAAQLQTLQVTTRRGIDTDVLVGGPEDGAPVVFFHGLAGHLGGEPLLQALAAAGVRVHAPVWPGYGVAGGEERLRDMLDFALHGADVVDALELGPAHAGPPPHLIGHCMGAMIAGEMAAMAPYGYGCLALLAPLGLWLDEHPIPDVFAQLPFEFPPLLFHDVELGTRLLAGGEVDFDDPQAIQRFLIGNSRRLGTAGKILFPIPNRRLSTRLYRITNPTLLVWGGDDRLLAPAYAAAWSAAMKTAPSHVVTGAGHMVTHEQPDQVARMILDHLDAAAEAGFAAGATRSSRDHAIGNAAGWTTPG